MNEAYQQHFAAVYDRLMEDMPYDRWQTFVREAWDQYRVTPQVVVDLGCGTGRNTTMFAQEGIHMIGIDRSEHMLADAQVKASHAAPAVQANGGSLTWLQQDMRDWDIARQADSVLCLCDGINYLLTDDDVRSAFDKTYQGLREGGLFLFDVLSLRQYETYAAEQPFTYDDDDLAYIWYSDWDETTRIMTHELTLFVQERPNSERFMRFQETHRQRAYTSHELTSWLMEAGFSRVDCYADFAWEHAQADAARLFVCAVK